MELKLVVRDALQRDADPYGDSRRAWDVAWRAVLEAVLKGTPSISDGTVLDMAPEVRRFVREDHSNKDTLYPRGEGWKANREGEFLVWSELWARLVFQSGDSQWMHFSSKDHDSHAEVQLAEVIARAQPLRSVTVYMNTSPCSDCSEALLRLLDARPEVLLSLRFASLFAHHGANHREGLLRLARRGVPLAVFGPRDWVLVAGKQRQVGDRVGNVNPNGVTDSRKRPAPENSHMSANGEEYKRHRRQ